jgi:hypothetical protein
MTQKFHDMEEKLTNLQEEAKRAGLNINVNKTKEVRVNNKIQRRLTVYRKEIEQVETFSYLGSTVTKKVGADEDVKNPIKKVKGAFIKLYPIWINKYISKKTKVPIFNTNVKSILLYACETWRATKQLTDLLQSFIKRCLRRIINIRWPETPK